MRNLIYVIVLIFITTTSLFGQKIANSDQRDIKIPSNVLIKGTSTLHDWESIVEHTEAKITVDTGADFHLETLEVKIKAKSIKSGKKVMDKLTYKALKAEKHPLITFIFKSGKIVNENADSLTVKLTGELTIAGITKEVPVLTTINKLGNEIILKGDYKLKMTEYGIKPPKALLGTIKTGNEITIEFSLKF